jgi:peptidoglycan/xylan/chitin deacetylase (PgdA/CDA1 family)
MTWEEVQQVATDGIQIGSHSVTHPVLAGLDDAQLLRELEVSKAEIERRLDRPCHAVAYPLGGDAGYSVSGAIAVDARVREFAAQCSYRTGFTYVPGVVQLATDDPLLLRRVPVERYLTRDEFAARLSLPGIFV